MAEPRKSNPRWRANIWRTVAWLADDEDYASFQLDAVWADGAERLPAEVYAIERKKPHLQAHLAQTRGGADVALQCAPSSVLAEQRRRGLHARRQDRGPDPSSSGGDDNL